MIISHKYKYIFLKTTKTAGTSIEISLSRFCGNDDIITPLTSADEKIRQELGVVPQNYENYTRYLAPWEYRLEDINHLITERKIPQISTTFYNHMSASRVKRGVGAKIWYGYYKFCFVRNPWDKAISRYYWNMKKQGTTETLDESLQRNNPNDNFGIYTMKNRLAVDYVGKYETLMEDLEKICKKLNIPFDGWMPNAKGNIRNDKRHYSEVFNQEQMEFVRKKCQKEIELFGYEF
ncbi:MAG: sulfotransferase family 2 domain-containing protein [Crocosphaera sp.]|nr:sulfotransferase family 2 domain-containing protein [Crocosphaera sp.]